MGVLPDRFHLRLMRQADQDAQNRALERWANSLPWPEAFFGAQQSDYTLTTTYALTGLSVVFTTYYPNAPVNITWTADTNISVTGSGAGQTRINIDGTPIAQPTTLLSAGAGAVGRSTLNGTLVAIIPTPGTHSASLEGRKLASGGTAQIMSVNSVIQVTSLA